MGEGGTSPLATAYLEKRANLVRFFAARIGLPAAEDLIQELWFKVEAASGEAVDNPSAYLHRLAHNLMLDRLRGEQRSAARDGAWTGVSRTTTASGEDVSEEPAADDQIVGRQRFEQLLAAVRDLPPQAQRAFRLHKLDGLSHAEVAQAMGVSRSAVEKHVSAAMKALLRKLG